MIIGSQPKFPSFLSTYREINRLKHIGSNYNINIVQLVSKFIIQPHKLHQQEKRVIIPGGALVFEVGYHPHKKKNYVIRVVFQEQAMYARTKNVQNWGENGMFLIIIIDKFWKGHAHKLRKTYAKMLI